MNRRLFLQSVSLAAFAAPTAPRAIRRVTRLYPEDSSPPRTPGLIPVQTTPEVLALEQRIICLAHPIQSPSSISAMTPSGDTLWTRHLPASNRYTGLGTTDAGKAILLEAGYNVLRLDPIDGSLTRLGKSDASGFNEKMAYAGDGYLIRCKTVGIELWRATTSEPAVRLLRRMPADVPPESQVELLSDGMAAVLSPTGDALWTVEIPSGNVRKIRQLPSQYVNEKPWRIVTGADRDRGLLLALFLPPTINSPGPLITIDANGYATPYGSFEPKSRTWPARLMRYGKEFGIACSDGSIAWYAA